MTRLYYGYCVLYSGGFFWVIVSLSFSLSLAYSPPHHLSLTFSSAVSVDGSVNSVLEPNGQSDQ